MKGKACALTIAGSDSGAGAGIQSDLKTFRNHGVYGVTVITAITAQNTKGVQKSYELPLNIIEAQLKSIFDDFTLGYAKTGMLSSAKVVELAVKYVSKVKNIKIVTDPVIFSKNGKSLLNKSGIKTLKEQLLPVSYLVTPNIPEAEILTGVTIDSIEDIETASVILNELGAKNVLIKGGHMKPSVGLPAGTDVLFDGKRFYMFNTHFINTNNTHGIGCTLSAAITANLALGNTLLHSVEEAKNYIVKSLKNSVKIGAGINPVEQ